MDIARIQMLIFFYLDLIIPCAYFMRFCLWVPLWAEYGREVRIGAHDGNIFLPSCNSYNVFFPTVFLNCLLFRRRGRWDSR